VPEEFHGPTEGYRKSTHNVSRDGRRIAGTSHIPSTSHTARPSAGPLQLPPTPAPSGRFVLPEERDADYTSDSSDGFFQGGRGRGGRDYQSRWRGGPRNVYGGLAGGLKRSPAISRRVWGMDTGDTGGTGETVPTSPSPMVTVMPGPGDMVSYTVEPEMPVGRAVSVASETHSSHSDGRSLRSHHTDRRSHRSNSRHSHHTDNRSYRTDSRSHHTDGPSHRGTHSIGHDTHDTHVTTHSARRYAPNDDEEAQISTIAAPVPAAEQSPEPVELRPSSDYDRMSLVPPPSVRSLSSRLVRLKQFLHNLNDLPWTATRITEDYIPSEQSRARYAHRAHSSWYPGARHSLVDLLEEDWYPSPSHPQSGQDHDYRNGRLGDRNRALAYSRDADYPIYPEGYVPEYDARRHYVYPSVIPETQPRPGVNSTTADRGGQAQNTREMQEVRSEYTVAPFPPPFLLPSEPTHRPPGAY
jgi:hypothetical protein